MKKEIGHSYPIFRLELLINSWTRAVNTCYLSANYLNRLTNIQQFDAHAHACWLANQKL